MYSDEEEIFEIMFLLNVDRHLSEAYKAKEDAAAALDEFPHKVKRQRAHKAATAAFETLCTYAIKTVKNLSLGYLIDESFPVLYRLKNSPLWDQVKLP